MTPNKHCSKCDRGLIFTYLLVKKKQKPKCQWCPAPGKEQRGGQLFRSPWTKTLRPKAQFIPSSLATSQEFLSRGYFGGEGPVTGKFGAGMGRMQPLPVIVLPARPPTAWSLPPTGTPALAAGYGRADRDLGDLGGAAEAEDLQLSVGFPVACRETPVVNEPTALWGTGKGHGLLADWSEKEPSRLIGIDIK